MIEINKIYNCDFRDKLHQIDKIDLIATDPPYNINFKYNNYKDSLSEKEYIDLLSNFRGYPCAIIHYPEETMKYILPAMATPPHEVVVWCYNSPLSRQSRLINFFNVNVDFTKVRITYKNLNDKRIITKGLLNGSEGGKMYDWFSDIQQVKNISKEKSSHPCPVPIKLMERIILLSTNPGDLVVDPFSGSGTTAIACINTNRNYIGFEIDKDYYEESLVRIDNAKGKFRSTTNKITSKLFISSESTT